MGAILLMRRRWRIPAGSLTIMLTFLALLWPMLSEYREAELIPALVLDRRDRRPAARARRLGRRRSAASGCSPRSLPLVDVGLFFLCVALFQRRRLGWEATLWVGLLATTAGLGYAVSLLVFPPYSGPVTERERWPDG